MFLNRWSKSARNHLFLFVAGLLCAAPVLANATASDMQCVETSASINGSQLLPHLYHYWDPAGAIKTPDLNAGHELSETAQKFSFARLVSPGERAVMVENQSNHWFRFCLRNITDQPQNLVVALEPPNMAEIDFYPQKKGLLSFKTGRTKKMSTRDIPDPQFDFTVRLSPGEEQVFYVRAYADTKFFLLAKLWDSSSYNLDNNLKENAFGIFVGVLLGLVIYNALLFLSVRQTLSLFYIAWSISIFILLSSFSGRLVQHVAPDYPQFSRIVNIIFYPLSVFLSAFFYQKIIKLKDYPKLNHAGNILLGVSVLSLLIAYWYDIAVYFKVCAALAIIFASYFGLLAPIYSLIKDRLFAAKYLLIAQAPLFICIFDRALFVLGVTSEYYIPYTAKGGLIAAMIIISYYIGLMVYKEKEAAQRSAFERLNNLNTLKSSYNEQLERELERKTADIRSMNSDLEQQAKKLSQLDQSKSKFFANISHEFRTPLTLIEGPLTMLLEQEGFPEKQTLEGVVRNSNSLKGLIDQILLLSELDENSLDLKASKTNVVQAVNEFAAQFASMFEQNGIRLSCAANPPEIKAYVDYEKLQIIINNLLSNAAKFTPRSGQVTIDISSTAANGEHKDEYSSDEYVQIIVRDTGQGIPDNELVYIFDRYFQSDSSEASKSGLGTGIGLALVKELAELHAGGVTVESVYSQENSGRPSGTSFCVTLPLGRAHLNDNEIVQDLNPETQHHQAIVPSVVDQDGSIEPTDKSQGKPATVLVVDDNEDMRRHIRRLLEQDYRVVTAQDGLLAEKSLNEQLPDLIVTDLMMPNRNGLEFVDSIKKNDEFAKIPIIMLTARAGLDDRIKGLIAAVDDYLVKPFNGRELKIRIKNLLNKQAQFNAFYQNQGLMSDYAPESESNNESETYIDKVKAVVNQRLMEPDFGVDDLAEALHISETTLRRRLSNQANFTPAAFIRHCRLERARHLLGQGKVRSIAELANAVGFNQPSYFARLYERTFNCKVDIHNKPESI